MARLSGNVNKVATLRNSRGGRVQSVVEADRVELFTAPYALAHHEGPEAAKASLQSFAAAAELAHEHGLGVNAGHDLDRDNPVLFRELPHLDEVSIGHALIGEALLEGLAPAVRRYLEVLAEAS